jgi:hypothetical protein
MLRGHLGSHYEVQEEVPVGKKLVQIGLLPLHMEQGEQLATDRQILAGSRNTGRARFARIANLLGRDPRERLQGGLASAQQVEVACRAMDLVGPDPEEHRAFEDKLVPVRRGLSR